MGNMKPNIHFIGGPTASGKTAKALEIAHMQPTVVINADSMQVYKGLPLLTAQPTDVEKTRCLHKLFEALDPSERCSVGRWLEMAEAALVQAEEEDLTPIIVGGTGLYFRALEDGLADMPEIPLEVRNQAAVLYDEIGHDAFRVKLSTLDPSSAQKIEKNDRQRLLRAYEVVAHTGKKLGDWQKRQETGAFANHFTIHRHVLLPDREELYARCDARFLQMVEDGALDEVNALIGRKLDPELPAMKILGVRELAAHLRGEMLLGDAIAKAQQLTRNYAKRQMTWFRNQWPSCII